MKNQNYKNAGVDIDAATKALKTAAPFIKQTHSKNVINSQLSYGSLFDLKNLLSEYKNPVLVQSADGVGTKLILARIANSFKSIGADIVNHCCNDILCMGAKPITFLDYIAVEKLNSEMVSSIIKGIAIACKENNLSLVGGETAEMPGVYIKNEFDIAGFITGLVEKEKIIDSTKVKDDNIIIGLRSSGLHTNGYSLVRKVFEKSDLFKYYDELSSTLIETLLITHKNYTNQILPLLEKNHINAIVHITGGGFIDNIPRLLNENQNAIITTSAWQPDPVFEIIGRTGNIKKSEMYRTFNMGIGLILIVDEENVDKVRKELTEQDEKTVIIGRITKGNKQTIIQD